MLSYVIVQLHSNMAAVATAAVAATILAKLELAVQMLWYVTENTSTTTERKTNKKQAQPHIKLFWKMSESK